MALWPVAGSRVRNHGTSLPRSFLVSVKVAIAILKFGVQLYSSSFWDGVHTVAKPAGFDVVVGG